MNRLRFISDLHLEFAKSLDIDRLKPIYNVPEKNVYYLALLGDIGNPYKPQLNEFFSRISPLYKKIFFIPGNHEYYNLDFKGSTDFKTVQTQLKQICSSYNNIVYLDNKVDYIGNFKLIGSTLWSHVDQQNEKYISTKLNDYNLIKKSQFNNITVTDTNQWNSDAIHFIESELSTNVPCVVLTHHAPLFSNPSTNQYTANPKYYGGLNNQAFHNNLKHLIKPPIFAWLYGHTHYAGQFYFNGVLIATNQLGYINEQNSIDFNPLREIVLDIDEYTDIHGL